MELTKETTVKSPVAELPIHEIFLSLQGEGNYTGTPAWFIRTAGCNVGCHWCDVKESWNIPTHAYQSIDEIIDPILKSKTEWVVVTGGEPLMHDLDALTIQLKNAEKKVMLETSGSSTLSGFYDWVACSPKKFKAPLDSVLAKTDEFKVVIFHPSDLKWAEGFLPKLKKGCRLSLQAEWSKRDQITPLILDFIDHNPQWNLSVQTHKYLNIR